MDAMLLTHYGFMTSPQTLSARSSILVRCSPLKPKIYPMLNVLDVSACAKQLLA
jgi:hypothetical protein